MRNKSIKMSLYSRAARGYKVTRRIPWVVSLSVCRVLGLWHSSTEEMQHNTAEQTRAYLLHVSQPLWRNMIQTSHVINSHNISYLKLPWQNRTVQFRSKHSVTVWRETFLHGGRNLEKNPATVMCLGRGFNFTHDADHRHVWTIYLQEVTRKNSPGEVQEEISRI